MRIPRRQNLLGIIDVRRFNEEMDEIRKMFEDKNERGTILLRRNTRDYILQTNVNVNLLENRHISEDLRFYCDYIGIDKYLEIEKIQNQ